MDFKNLMSDENLHDLKELSTFIPVVRASISKTWRLVDKLDKMMAKIMGGKDVQSNKVL